MIQYKYEIYLLEMKHYIFLVEAKKKQFFLVETNVILDKTVTNIFDVVEKNREIFNT